MAGKSFFMMGFSRGPFQPFYLGQSSFDSLPPDQKASQIQDLLDQAMQLQGKVLGAVNQTYGGIGSDQLKALLGSDYDTFNSYFQEQLADSDLATKLYGELDPSQAANLTSTDYQAAYQWQQTLTAMVQILSDHGVAGMTPPAPPAPSGPAATAPAQSPSAPVASSSLAPTQKSAPAPAASQGPPLGTIALGAAGVIGVGALVYFLV